MRRISVLAGIIVAAALALPVLAQAAPTNLVVNGSFEQGYLGVVPCECDLQSDEVTATWITGWTVVVSPQSVGGVGSVDWLDQWPGQPASDGIHNIDLSGYNTGAIEQQVPTTPGVTYTVTFDLAANPGEPGNPVGPDPKVLLVVAGNTSTHFTTSTPPPNYAHETVTFVAGAGTTSLLEFAADEAESAAGPIIDNVVVTGPAVTTPANEDACENGNYSNLGPGNGVPFTSQAACDAFATHTTLVTTLPNGGNCNNLTLNGNYTGDVTVPENATCVLAPGIVVSHDVNVKKGATLYDEGANIQHHLGADTAKGVDIDPGSRIGEHLQIQGLTGVPAGETVNEICGATIVGNLIVQKGTAAAPVEVGCVDEGGNTVGNDLNVLENAAPVSVSHNAVGHDLNVQKNTPGGATVNSNSAVHQVSCQGNAPAAGSGNTPIPKDPKQACNVS